jgi:hypothetical protein
MKKTFAICLNRERGAKGKKSRRSKNEGGKKLSVKAFFI